MRVYLASNVLVDVCDGRAPGLATLLPRAVDAGTYSFPFTAEQVSEITFASNGGRNDVRLKFLLRLSRDLYFVRSVYDFGFRTESPLSVYATLNEVVLESGVERGLANMISYEEKRRAREALGLDSFELNNLSPREAISRIEKALASYEHDLPPSVAVPRPLPDFLSYGEKNTREQFSELWVRMRADPEHMLLDHKIVSLFSLFDTFGFWPDDRVVYEKGSRFADSRHAFNASQFEVLVSRGKRLLNKAAAVYEYLGPQVSVQTAEAFERERGVSILHLLHFQWVGSGGFSSMPPAQRNSIAMRDSAL